LRHHCISESRSNPSKFNEATLGSSVDAYCRFFENPDHWDGYIEMDIVPRFYMVEVCVPEIGEWSMVPMDSCQAAKRIFLLSNGIHYNSVMFRGFGGDEVRQLAVDDMRGLGARNADNQGHPGKRLIRERPDD
jgi:ubiquitin thioesterase OTU1